MKIIEPIDCAGMRGARKQAAAERSGWNSVGPGTPLHAWLETRREGETGTNVCMARILCIGDDVEWCERPQRSEISDNLVGGRTTVTHSTFLPPTHWRWPADQNAHG